MNGWSYNMDFGLIGKNINYSYSQEIHRFFTNSRYEIVNLELEELADFLKQRNFKGLNVTIPYKQAVIPYLDCLDEIATKTGVVNTIVNEKGTLKGYNTDYYSFVRLLEQEKIELSGKKCLVLGSGATSKTVLEALKNKNTLVVDVASRLPQKGKVSYQSLSHQHYDIVINTTPVGTYPEYNEAPVDITTIDQVEYLIDFIYNPLRTKLIRTAIKANIKTINGLKLLVSQAYYARKLFDQKEYKETMIDEIAQKITQNKLNIVLIGMPYSGKTTLAHELAAKLHRQVIDTDELIEKQVGETIRDIFIKEQETGFRKIEKQVIGELKSEGNIIATGGGSVLDEDNMAKLSGEGIVFYLVCDKESISFTKNTRPLLKNIDDWQKLAGQREHLYVKYADFIIPFHASIEEKTNDICKKYWEYIKRGK